MSLNVNDLINSLPPERLVKFNKRTNELRRELHYPPTLIGLAGQSGSGKDLIGDYIESKYGYTKIAVADDIREESANFLVDALLLEGTKLLANAKFKSDVNFGLVLEAFRESIYEKPTPKASRVLLQWFGTEYWRNLNPKHWLNILEEKIIEIYCRKDFNNIIVTDIRLPEEIDLIRKYAGEVWLIRRKGVDPVGIPNHHTEVAYQNQTFDRIIDNNQSIRMLQKKIDWIFQNTSSLRKTWDVILNMCLSY